MKACSTCTNRWLADLFEALGDKDKAAEIREKGCHFWQIVPNIETDVGYVETCVGANFERFCRKYGQDILLASDTVQADRGEQKKALDAIRETAKALGYPDTFAMLAQLGFRAAVGHEVIEKQRLAEGANGEGVPE